MRLSNDLILETIAKHEGKHLTTNILAEELDFSLRLIQKRIITLEKQGKIERYFTMAIIKGDV